MKIHTSDIPAKDLAEAITERVQNHQGNTICLTAGGSALEIFSYLTDEDVKRRTIFMMGDERASGEGAISNFLQLQAKLGDAASGYQIVDTTFRVNETLDEYASRLSQKISDLQTVQNHEQIFAILGMGTDGHTAGIFPLPEESFLITYEADQPYVPVHIESLKIDSRASITPRFILNNVDQLFVYAVGEAKESVVKNLVQNTKKVFEQPAQLINEHANAELFTDINLDLS